MFSVERVIGAQANVRRAMSFMSTRARCLTPARANASRLE